MTTSRRLDDQKIRDEFPMLRKPGKKPFVYLDSAASSQTAEPVLKAMDNFYRKFRANVHRGMYPASAEATEKYEAARAAVARMLNAETKEVVFTRGATDSLNLIAQMLSRKLRPGDEVVISLMEHHSNLVPWQQLAKRYGFTLKFIGITSDFELDMNQARALIGPAVKVVAITHVSNALGAVSPIAELSQLAHGVGAVLVVDAAQSAGHRTIDVRDFGADFLAFSGHKMFGPTGIGVLWGRQAILEKLEPLVFGGDMILEVSQEESVWNELPWKFEAGTPNIAGAIGLGAAADFVREIGEAKISSHERDLAESAATRLSAIPGVKVYGPPLGHDRGGVVSFGVGDIHPHDLSSILASQGVCVRGGHHCTMPLMRYLQLPGTTRASFSAYSSTADVDALIAAVTEAKRIFKI